MDGKTTRLVDAEIARLITAMPELNAAPANPERQPSWLNVAGPCQPWALMATTVLVGIVLGRLVLQG